MPPPRVVDDHRNSVGEVEAAAALDHGDAQELFVPDSGLSGVGETSAFCAEHQDIVSICLLYTSDAADE